MARGRAMAEARMTDTCTVRFLDPDAEPVQDEETGAEVRPTVTRFTSPCRLTNDVRLVESDAGGRQVAIAAPVLNLPVSAGPLSAEEDDEVEFVPPSSPEVLGRLFRIAGTPTKSQATALRFPLREV